jgi:hypothetical protein
MSGLAEEGKGKLLGWLQASGSKNKSSQVQSGQLLGTAGSR